MAQFEFFASPWWVNFFILVPFIAYASWHKRLSITWAVLIFAALFGIAFGFVEAAAVVYIRAASGLLTVEGEKLTEVAVQSSNMYQQAQVLADLPAGLWKIEFFRELATMVMLLCVTMLGARGTRERIALFLWSFATWDIFYYVGLWATIRWPASLTTPDVLFLIPVPWFSQVWFPMAVSALIMGAVVLKKTKNHS
ncbi:MAG: hypothetical protein A2722_01705 [Candidatus Doudnabacteria bacterium RIFCSPHIGHO2_01_FULL_50_11]|uniref:Uncharacterized protein n=1 Tax=Candidatus Doudnabacteria bacterium RIFCSPHIGHO2_01_FULL_50_11 TaxID=1817828 RepID=A0A1F5PEZ7_9BACT|nr:MAG: hypothetical protein A2722_01705 [Candidatus Doudnabacteria bacterium RIFCSPHIGHO2_01_FULL_50_11]